MRKADSIIRTISRFCSEPPSAGVPSQFLFVRTKRNQKGAQGVVPLESPQFGFYLRYEGIDRLSCADAVGRRQDFLPSLRSIGRRSSGGVCGERLAAGAIWSSRAAVPDTPRPQARNPPQKGPRQKIRSPLIYNLFKLDAANLIDRRSHWC